MRNNQRGIALVQVVWIVAGLMVIVVAGWHIAREFKSPTVEFTTPYQAVLLANGSVYFGHLQGYGGYNPVLTDVYYIVSQTNPETKQVNNVLVKRGKELHEPDRMYLKFESTYICGTRGHQLQSGPAHLPGHALAVSELPSKARRIHAATRSAASGTVLICKAVRARLQPCRTIAAPKGVLTPEASAAEAVLAAWIIGTLKSVP